MNKYFSLRLFAVLAVALMSIGYAVGQTSVTGAMTGRVTDPQDAVIANATVKVTNLETGSVSTVTTSSEGTYRVENLQPGNYKIEVTASGFATGTSAKDIVVEVSKPTSVDVKLGLVGATAQVEVTGETPVINTVDATNSTNINQVTINNLPINGRRAASFALLTPGVNPDGGFGLLSFRGVSGLMNNSTIDGGDNNQAFFSEERGRTRINYVISQSAIREFQVNTSNYSAEYGRSAGGVVVVNEYSVAILVVGLEIGAPGGCCGAGVRGVTDCAVDIPRLNLAIKIPASGPGRSHSGVNNSNVREDVSTINVE